MSALLLTARTRIRPHTEEDIPVLLPIFGDPVTMAFWPQPFTAEQVGGWVRRAMAEHERTGLGRMVIEHRESG